MNLLDRLNCKTVLSPTPRPPQITAILESNPKLRLLEVTSVDELLKETYPHFSYNKSFSEARKDPLFVV